MGKQKADEINLTTPCEEVNGLPVLVPRNCEIVEGEVESGEPTSQVLVGASLNLDELPCSEELVVDAQLDQPTVSTGGEGVTANGESTAGTEGRSEADVEPYTFWQILELAGYELWHQ